MMFCLPPILQQRLSAFNGTTINYCPQLPNQTFISSANITVPTVITNDARFWIESYDATTLTLSTGSVDQWRDKSGNNRHLNQTGTNRPTLITNGLGNNVNSVRFDGVDDSMPLAISIPGMFPRTVFTVVKRRLTNSFIFTLTQDGAIGAFTAVPFSDSNLYVTGSGAFYYVNNTSNSPILTSEYVNTGLGQIFVNGAEPTLFTGVQVNGTGWNRVGARTANSQFGDGDIVAIVYFDRILTTTERQEVEGYLAWKTYLAGSLPSNHPYKNSYPGLTPVVGDSFYTIDYNINPIQASLNYCPQDTLTYTADGSTATVPTVVTNDARFWIESYDASTLTLSSGNVDQWRDKSGNNRHLNQTGTNRPTLITNGLSTNVNSVRFDGVDDSMPLAISIPGMFPRTVFTIVKRRLTNSFIFTLTQDGIIGAYTAVPFSDNNLYIAGIGNFYVTPNALNSPLLTCEIVNTGVGEIFINGTAASVSSGPSVTGSAWDRVGGRSATSQFGDGDIVAIIYFDRVLTTNERQQVEGYLAWKTNLVSGLPSNHPYKNSFPGVTYISSGSIFDFDNPP